MAPVPQGAAVFILLATARERLAPLKAQGLLAEICWIAVIWPAV